MHKHLLSITACSLGLASLAVAKGPQGLTLSNSVLKVLSQSTSMGAASPNEVLHLGFALRPRYPDELQAFCDSVSDPKSPTYRRFMTPAEVGESFGASADDVNATKSFLEAHGIKVTLVADNRMEILAEATVGQ